MNIGLVPMSAKPYHAGHDGLVRIAAGENGIVKLFVSTTDRARSGEMKIDGETMQIIWWDYIEPTLPENVIVDYCRKGEDSPVGKVYKELEVAEQNKSKDTFMIYSDDKDILDYSDESLKNAAPKLFANGQIIRRGISRSETVDVSGTEMREFIEDGDVVGFTALLPRAMQYAGREIFDLLIDDTMGESLLKRYIGILLKESLLKTKK